MADDSAEFARQRALLATDVGVLRSGAARYGAAMYFFNLGLISGDMLEIYRRCCKFDQEDPIAIAEYEGVAMTFAALDGA